MQTFSHIWSDFKTLEAFKKTLPLSSMSTLIQVFWDKLSHEEIPVLQQQLRQLFPEAQVMGTTTAGNIVEGEVVDETVSIVVSLFEKTTVKTVLVKGEQHPDFGEQVRQKMGVGSESLPTALICFLDGFSDGEWFADSMEKAFPEVPLAGGLAGDDLRFAHTCVFDAEQILEQGAVVTGLFSDTLEVYQQFNFNWQPVGLKFEVTKSEQNIVYEIEGKNALEFYAEYLGEEITQNYMPQIAMEFPLIFEKSGMLVARACLQVLEGGALSYAGDIPQGTVVQFGLGAHHQIIRDSVEQTHRLLGCPAESIFIYSCVARRLLLGEDIQHEVQPLQVFAPANGFFTYGELVHLNHKNSLLNQTLTLLVLSEGVDSHQQPKNLTYDVPELNSDFREIMLEAMAHLATRLAVGLEEAKQQYEELAEHDQLTGLYNRYGGERRIQQEVARAEREGQSMAMSIIDIDHFKEVNDTFGHTKGDEVLRQLADDIRQHIRSYDIAIRWGGEEFLIVFPHMTAQEAKQKLDQLRETFGRHDFGLGYSLSFSGGVIEWSPVLSEMELFKKADEALYRAKEAGRNQILICQKMP